MWLFVLFGSCCLVGCYLFFWLTVITLLLLGLFVVGWMLLMFSWLLLCVCVCGLMFVVGVVCLGLFM